MSGLVHYNSPIGKLALYSNGDAIYKVLFDAQEEQADTPDTITIECKKELEAYFQGKTERFTVPLAIEGTAFQKKVWQLLMEIPYGSSISYGELATRLGDIKAIRAVGTANGRNKIPILIPCHRVIGKDGSLTGFAGGLDKKEWLLRHEGTIQGKQMHLF